MLVLLPPSETKAPGGTGGPLDLGSLSFDCLNTVRVRLIDATAALADDLPAALKALKLTARQADQVDLNGAVRRSPTMPAIQRYTGVLYDALAYGSLPRAARMRADRMVVLTSALFGALRAADPIPAYRLSGSSVLPGIGTLPSLWRPVLVPALRSDELVVDLRSSAYAGLAPLPGAVTVRVLTEATDGTRTVVSHFNKHTKGLLARALVSSRAEPSDLRALLRVMRRAGFTVEHASPLGLDLVTAA